MNFWENKRVLVTGGNGFVGQHVVKELLLRKACLINCFPNADMVIHLAAKMGGVQFNIKNQITQFQKNLSMAIWTLEEARKARVLEFLLVSSACIYGEDAPQPLNEAQIGLE